MTEGEEKMVEKTYPMTLEGKAKLEQELEELKTVKRGEIIERIKSTNQQKMNKLLSKVASTH